LKSQLSRLYQTAREVEREPQLQVRFISDQLDHIYSIVMELQPILQDMEALQRKSRLIQGFHALGLKPRDDDTLKDILARLRDAQNDLTTRIDVVHVRATGGVVKGVERLEQDVQTIITRDVRPEAQHRYVIDKNVAGSMSTQQNQISVMDHSTASSAMISHNEALDNSQQMNTIYIDHSALRHLLKDIPNRSSLKVA
jgi:hypothetical protein